MTYGLPVVMTNVGGNVEAAAGYKGIVLVPPGDPAALLGAIRKLPGMIGKRYVHPHRWSDTADAYEQLFTRLEARQAT